MLDVPIPNNQVVTVMVAQTTFSVVTIPGKQLRVDYLDKVEVSLKPGMRGPFIRYSEHPLLLAYDSPLVSVYINSKPQDPQELDIKIKATIEAQLQGWRDLSSIICPHSFQQNLLDGSGILLQAAPVPIAQAVINTCTKQSVLTWATPSFGGLQDKMPFHLLLIGDGYVIARDFRFTEVLTKTPPLPSQ